MSNSSEKLWPATFWRAFFLCLLAPAALAAPPPTATPPPLAQVGKPDQAEMGRILEQFRQSGWHGYVQFELHALPRRGDEAVYRGQLWGGEDEHGPVTRIELTDANGAAQRFLLQNGAEPAVWRSGMGKPERVADAAVFQPLIPGVEITAFDLLMPYLYWPGVRADGVVRLRGRPSYVFVFTPPAGSAATGHGIRLIRAYFDAQFGAPVEVQLLGSDNTSLKTTSLVELKKAGEAWIPKTFDVRNDATRDKTRFEVTGAAPGMSFASAVFTPAGLEEPVSPPPSEKVLRIGE